MDNWVLWTGAATVIFNGSCAIGATVDARRVKRSVQRTQAKREEVRRIVERRVAR